MFFPLCRVNNTVIGIIFPFFQSKDKQRNEKIFQSLKLQHSNYKEKHKVFN